MAIKNLFLSLFLLLSFATITLSERDDCVYTIYIRTGSIFKGGSDSIMSLRLYDKYGSMVEIKNLEAWGGLMGPGHNYYERGNLDIFSGRGTCLTSSVCAMNLTSDNSNPHPGWYVNYVEVTATGVHGRCNQMLFTVEQWLYTKLPPFQLSAIINNCPVTDDRRDGSVIKSVRSGM